VGCDPRDTHRLYLQYPKLLVEIASDSTERLDRREKRWAYQTIETLEEYVLVAQDRPEVTSFRRVNDWSPETVEGRERAAHFKALEFTLPLSSIYEGVSAGSR
jgi:Uma2 family endonuclease